MEGERRLFDLTRGGCFTLLSFGATPAIAASLFNLNTLNVTAPDVVAIGA